MPNDTDLRPGSALPSMIYRSLRMQQLDHELMRAARSPGCVLLQGETGTGKDVAAKRLWGYSARSSQHLVSVNAAAYTKELFEAEWFGVAPQAVTGVKAKIGLLHAAHQSGLFLDEIGELNLELQAKLLRVLQERTFRRVGGISEETVDVRFLAATNKNLLNEVRAGRFREDLYHRIAVHVIEVPPLRERPEDISLLTRHFCQAFATERQQAERCFSPAAERLLQSYRWPGNVRELANTIEACLTRCDDSAIGPEHLQEAIRGAGPSSIASSESSRRTRPPLASQLDYDRVARPGLASRVLTQLLHGGRVVALLETYRGGGKTLVRQLVRHCTGMAVVWLHSYATENISREEFYGLLTASDEVRNQIEFGRWLRGQSGEAGLLIVLHGIQGPEDFLEEVAATIRSALADHNDAAFLVIGGRRLLNLRKQERYSWLRLLPSSSFIDAVDLTEAEVTELVRLHGRDADLAAPLYAATGGHPWLLFELIASGVTDPEQMDEIIRYHLSLTGKLEAHLRDPKALAVLQRLLRGEAVRSLADPGVRHEPNLHAESRLYFDGFLRWDKTGRTQLRCQAVRMLLHGIE